jgi:cytosine deaminase
MEKGLILTNCRLKNRDRLCDITIENGRFKSIVPAAPRDEGASGGKVLDAGGKLVLPPFVEPHIHLDFVFTAGIPRHNVSGSLFEGIQIWSERKIAEPLTVRGVRDNAIRAIKQLAGFGVQAIRSHVDTTDPNMIALTAMLEVKDAVRDIAELQLVAFPQEGIRAFPDGEKLLERAIQMGADAVGGIPHFEYCREYGVDSLETTIDLACKYDRLVDVHCDEIDDPASRFLEVLATKAYETGLADRVTASHTVAMHSYDNAYCSKLFNILTRSRIQFACCPAENTHLQGRADNYPRRRGVTRVKELTQAGLNVAFGQDSISDPWYPLGTGNLLRVLEFGLHVTQMTGFDEISDSLEFITSHGAKLLRIEDHYGIEEGKPANCIILNCTNDFDAVRNLSEVLYSIRNGKTIMKCEPASRKLL